jgi:alpha-ketoglutarate-dependent taurine dioxygenase
MKIELHENGWTIIIRDDIRTLSEDEVREVIRLTVKNMVVVFPQQTLTLDDEVRFCKIAGNVQQNNMERAKHIALSDNVIRVTGKKNADGQEGLFGHKEDLDWHANQPSNPVRNPLIWLYAEQGTVGSRTSWINNIMSYRDLHPLLKEQIKDIEIYCGYKNGQYSTSEYFKDHVNLNNPIKLVQTNEEGETGLFLPFLQIFGFKDCEETKFRTILEKLKAHVLQEKYMYHHNWQDGDIVISEQWLSIHKRWYFENMEERVLHRIAFDHAKIYK